MIARGLVSAASLGVVLLASSVVSAQACDDGRLRVGGHCCWPGQTWSRADRVCDGVPQCPAGMAEEGEGCVPRAVTASIMAETPPTSAPLIRPVALSIAASGPTIQGTSATSVDGWPQLPGARPDGVMNPVLRRGTDDGLVFGGLITLGAGYVLGFIVGIADSTAANCRDWGSTYRGCNSGALALIPIFGASLSGTVVGGGVERGHRFEDALGMALGIPMAITQVVGLVIFFYGIANYTLDIDEARADLGGGASLRLELSAPSSDAGLSAVVSF